jgi:hypothetical protein
MSFSKNIYDKESYKQSINQSVGPGIYRMATPPISCKPCYPYPPTVRLQRQGDSVLKNTLLIDVDSELSGITRKLSKNITQQYLPSCPDSVCESGEVCGQGVVGTCSGGKPGERATDSNLLHMPDCFVPAEDTRLTNPPCNLRGTGWNRWESLCKNPQERVEMPFDWNINNRIVVKDNHRPCIPNPIDPTSALPIGGEMPCEQTSLTCAAFTQPSSVNWQTESNIRNY